MATNRRSTRRPVSARAGVSEDVFVHAFRRRKALAHLEAFADAQGWINASEFIRTTREMVEAEILVELEARN